MEQGGGREPGHEGGVFHRVPEPEAAPAELVIGPPASKRDAGGQARPGCESPRAHPARPGPVHPAFQQGRDGEGERHREADIAEIEQRRMEGEAGVLQQRVQARAVERRRPDARKRVGGEQREGEEARAEHRLDGKHARLERLAQAAAEHRNHRAEQRQDQHPEQQRSFVVSPHPGKAVEQRLERMGVLRHRRDRKVGRDIGPGERAERDCGEEELAERRVAGEFHQRRLAPGGSVERQCRLQQGEAQCQREREMSEFRRHDPSAFCARRSASAASGGI